MHEMQVSHTNLTSVEHLFAALREAIGLRHQAHAAYHQLHTAAQEYVEQRLSCGHAFPIIVCCVRSI